MKANLDQTYRWKNKYYGPGENVEIPQELADAASIKKPAAKSAPPSDDEAGKESGGKETK